MKFDFEDYVVDFPDSMEYKIFDEEWYYGIIFKVDGSRYEIIHNRVGWDRIIINYKDSSWSDLPFNEGTFRFLPEGVTLKKRI